MLERAALPLGLDSHGLPPLLQARDAAKPLLVHLASVIPPDAKHERNLPCPLGFPCLRQFPSGGLSCLQDKQSSLALKASPCAERNPSLQLFLWAVGREAADSPNSAASSQSSPTPAHLLQTQLHTQLQRDKRYSSTKFPVQVTVLLDVAPLDCPAWSFIPKRSLSTLK